jgi:hypothetical protein
MRHSELVEYYVHYIVCDYCRKQVRLTKKTGNKPLGWVTMLVEVDYSKVIPEGLTVTGYFPPAVELTFCSAKHRDLYKPEDHDQRVLWKIPDGWQIGFVGQQHTGGNEP